MPRKATETASKAWNVQPVDSNGQPLPYPPETLELMSRKPAPGRKEAWWAEAVHQWETYHAKPRWGSAWLPAGFDPYAVCPALGPTGLACADPWCSEPGVVAPGHDRRRSPDLSGTLNAQRRSPRPVRTEARVGAG